MWASTPAMGKSSTRHGPASRWSTSRCHTCPMPEPVGRDELQAIHGSGRARAGAQAWPQQERRARLFAPGHEILRLGRAPTAACRGVGSLSRLSGGSGAISRAAPWFLGLPSPERGTPERCCLPVLKRLWEVGRASRLWKQRRRQSRPHHWQVLRRAAWVRGEAGGRPGWP